jgi:hypothetical protein
LEGNKRPGDVERKKSCTRLVALLKARKALRQRQTPSAPLNGRSLGRAIELNLCGIKIHFIWKAIFYEEKFAVVSTKRGIVFVKMLFIMTTFVNLFLPTAYG